MSKIEIIDFENRYTTRVKELNYEWLFKHSLWEPLDDTYLNNPQKMILDPGGFIFLASAEDEIVGTVALVPAGDGIMEICKLAVTEKMQGQQIGLRLMEKCINMGKTLGLQKIILFTNSRLTHALKLYEKIGFCHSTDSSEKYEEADLKLELPLA